MDSEKKIKIIEVYPYDKTSRKETYKEEMINCDVCNTKRKIVPSNTFSTRIHWYPFFDERGESHLHDKNESWGVLECEKGHRVSVSLHYMCPNSKCDWIQSDD